MEDRWVADPFHENLGFGMSGPQLVTGLMGFSSEFVVPGVNVNRHELTVVGRFEETLQSRLVNRRTALADLYGDEGECWHGGSLGKTDLSVLLDCTTTRDDMGSQIAAFGYQGASAHEVGPLMFAPEPLGLLPPGRLKAANRGHPA